MERCKGPIPSLRVFNTESMKAINDNPTQNEISILISVEHVNGAGSLSSLNPLALGWGCSSVAECFPSMCKALDFISSTVPNPPV
jgi:hypothetical protein